MARFTPNSRSCGPAQLFGFGYSCHRLTGSRYEAYAAATRLIRQTSECERPLRQGPICDERLRVTERDRTLWRSEALRSRIGALAVVILLGVVSATPMCFAAASETPNAPQTSAQDTTSGQGFISDTLDQARKLLILRGARDNPAEGAKYFFIRGTTELEAQENAKAIEDFSYAISFKPNFLMAYQYRAMAYESSKEYDKTLEDLNACVKLTPDRSQSWADRGAFRVRRREYDLAILDLDEAIRLDPRRGSALTNRGHAYYDLGQYDKALRDLNEAVGQKYSDAQTWRGWLELALGRLDEANTDFTAALQADPKSSRSLYGLGLLEKHTGKTEAADRDIAAARAIQPEIESYIGSDERLR